MDNEICEARMGSSRHTAWVLHVIRFGLDALPANPPQPAGQRGADEGDILIAEFDLTKNLALLRLGDDELLEEMSPEV